MDLAEKIESKQVTCYIPFQERVILSFILVFGDQKLTPGLLRDPVAI